MGICLSAQIKAESPCNTGLSSKNVSTDGTDLNSTGSKVSSISVPPTPRSEGEILQASNLKSFSFSDLKMATRNFRPDSVLGEGGFGSVFKGWIDEQTFAATKPGTGIVIAVKRLNQDGLQGHNKNIWARFYVPIKFHGKLPLLVYFHGGGFCVGSAAWSCYHDFLARLAAKANCIIMSVNYRLAPENPLPAAYDDGIKALMWLKQQALCGGADNWWTCQWSFSDIFLAGDSAGANIAFNVITRLDSFNAGQAAAAIKPLKLKGIILIQPFFGGEARTHSEKYLVQSPRSALNLAASDTYWRLALPCGANRDHPWCNPLAKGSVKLEGSVKFPIMVCISEMDILKDRNLELVASLGRAGKRVEHVVCKGVGHAFQILSKSQLSQTRTLEIMARIEGFISGTRSPLSTTVHNLM